MSERVVIFDTTLRDGEQTPGVSLTPAEKMEIAMQLARLRVDIIEAGFPITSPGDLTAVQSIAERVRGPVICGLARANKADIDAAWKAVKNAEKPRIHTFIATSEVHMKHKLRKTPDEVLKAAEEAVLYAKSFTPDVEFSAEDATRSDPEFLYRIFDLAVRAGATTINIPDTVGYTTPNEFYELIEGTRRNVKGMEDVVISVHCHNDLGMAVANSLAAIEAGATQVECTINGLGERAGNASLEEIVMALGTRNSYYGKKTNIATDQIYRTSRLVTTLTGVPIQPNKAVVGANAFAHQSGIHQDGVLKQRLTYEIMTPESVGLPSNRIVLGKVSGRHAFRSRLEELGYEVPEAELDRLFRQFKDLADRKKDITDRDIEAIVENELHSAEPHFVLDYYHISTGSSTVPTATVRVLAGATGDSAAVVNEAASGDGPVDAVFKAIDRAARMNCRLTEYTLRAVTSGKDALGEASIKVEAGGRLAAGRGVSVDVVEASAKAYVNAINRLWEMGVRQVNGVPSNGNGANGHA
ncbi:MAG: 2-isopropylmalate synthase [Firmicutes bacterium]|nr:2-isopropylmalate synthase [Bacillota bacterium]